MKAKTAAAIAMTLMLVILASCSLPKLKEIDVSSITSTKTEKSVSETEMTETQSDTSESETENREQTGESTASVSGTSAQKIAETTEKITEKITETLTKATTAVRTSRTTTQRTSRTTTTRAARTTTTRATTTKAPSTSSDSISGYSGRVDKTEKVYNSDLKYGVDLHRYVTLYYGYDANGKKFLLKEEETNRVYDRSTYIASYNDLLPAAKANRQTYAAYINEVLRLTNNMRAAGGLAPLTLDEKLTTQANVRAEELAWSGKHSHYRPNLQSYTSLFKENGYTTGISGENLGWYYSTPADVCAAWKASQSHYENIMNPNFKKIGIGVAAEPDPTKNLCWVQHFYSG